MACVSSRSRPEMCSCARRRTSEPTMPAARRSTAPGILRWPSHRPAGSSFGSVEEAKYAAAQRKISISSQHFSRRNRSNSGCSAMLIVSLSPSSMSGQRIHWRTHSSAIPKSVATSMTVTSPLLAIATTFLLNSSAYPLGMTTSSRQAMKPAHRVSS